MGNLLQLAKAKAGGVAEPARKSAAQTCADPVRISTVQAATQTHVLAPEIESHLDRLMKEHAGLWSKLA
jgi:hypothetical protein